MNTEKNKERCRDYYHRTKEERKKVHGAYYRKNSDAYKKRAVERKRNLRVRVSKLKEGPCGDCGGTFNPVCMDFDHRDPTKKDNNVSHGVSRGWGWDRIKKEIEKCDLVCANCHRVRTFKT